MISIVICSRNADIPLDLKENISVTIGAEYELIIIDNSSNKYSIFSAYNEGVRRSKGDVLCFAHEDILFRTQDWGKVVINCFKDRSNGLLGVVGGHYLPDCPASWWSTESRSGQVLQGYHDKKNHYQTEHFYWANYKTEKESIVNVSAVDGLWFCIPAYLFKKVKFDDHIFKGFHCYDSDICLQILKLGLNVSVTFEILIEHISYGQQNAEYYFQKKLLFNKWKDLLPVLNGAIMSDRELSDRNNFVRELNKLIEKNIYSELELISVKKSKAYRIGKLLLKPIHYLRLILKK